MKLLGTLAMVGVALTIATAPAAAQHATRTTTTVTRVHGPLKVLPHHNRKICKVRWVHHKRVRKCWYR